MRKGKLLLLASALILATALPASAAEKGTVVVPTYSEMKGNVLYEEYQEIGLEELQKGSLGLSGANSKKVVVENPNKADTTGPSVKGASINKTSITTNKDGKNTVKVFVKISDAGVGFDYGDIVFKNAEGRSLYFYYGSGDYYYNKSKKAYEASATFNNPAMVGKYDFSYAFFYDKAGNRTEINATDKKCPSYLKKLSFKVVKGNVSAKASIESVSFSKSSLSFKSTDTKGKSVTSTAKVKTSGAKLESYDIHLRCQTSEYSWKGLGYYGRTAKSNTLTTKHTFSNESFYGGEWFVDELTLHFSNGDALYLSKDGGTIPEKITKKKIKVTVAGAKEIKDPSFPTVKAARFKESRVKLGKKKDGIVNIELTVSDKGTGISYASATFWSSKLGKSVTGYIYPKNPKKSGKIVIPVNISRALGSADFELSQITVKDLSGNETIYVPDDRSYGNREKIKYQKFISDMKGMTISVKNTYK